MVQNRFSVKLQRASNPWWGGGDPKLFSGRVPRQHWTPQNPDKYVRASGTRQKIGNKITSWENPCKKSKNEYFPHACAGVPDVCIYKFSKCLDIAKKLQKILTNRGRIHTAQICFWELFVTKNGMCTHQVHSRAHIKPRYFLGFFQVFTSFLKFSNVQKLLKSSRKFRELCNELPEHKYVSGRHL